MHASPVSKRPATRSTTKAEDLVPGIDLKSRTQIAEKPVTETDNLHSGSPSQRATRRVTRSTTRPENLNPGRISKSRTRRAKHPRTEPDSLSRSGLDSDSYRAIQNTTSAGPQDDLEDTQNDNSSSDSSRRTATPSDSDWELVENILQSVEAPTVGSASVVSCSSEDSIESTPDSGSDGDRSEEDPLEAFYERVGYLPPLDDSTIEVLKFLRKSYPDLDVYAGRISSIMGQEDDFEDGLTARNVDIEPEETENFFLQPQDGSESRAVSDSTASAKYKSLDEHYENLWARDRAKCQKKPVEAIFQRTMMISMIDRYRLFQGYDDYGKQRLLEFSVEAPWKCPPMPTCAAQQNENFLSAPMPDLAVGFYREKLWPSGCNWRYWPRETRKLVSYEGEKGLAKNMQAFNFMTIEAKKSFTDVDDTKGRNQSLNNASQALHNMYEFFKEADREGSEQEVVNADKYRNIFFDRVRFFSVVATSKAMKIRIHRADMVADDKKSEWIMPHYPLRFVYSDWKVIQGENFKYSTVVEELTKIMVDYGVNELATLLREAIRSVDQKFKKYYEVNGVYAFRDPGFYSYGQVAPKNRKSTTKTPAPTPGLDPSIQQQPRNQATSTSTQEVDDTQQSERQPSSRSNRSSAQRTIGPQSPAQHNVAGDDPVTPVPPSSVTQSFNNRLGDLNVDSQDSTTAGPSTQGPGKRGHNGSQSARTKKAKKG